MLMMKRLAALITTGMAAVFAAPASAGYMDTLNLPQGVTPISQEVYDLHMLILWICVAIGVVVFGAMFYSMFAHRKSKGAVAADFHESAKLEVLWTVVPFLILVGMAIPATKTLVFMTDTTESDMTVKITGHQWKWEYEYLNGAAQGVHFISSLAADSRRAIYGEPSAVENYLLEVDNEVVLPVGKKIHFVLTASDVIHAWWVPDLGQKQDAIPGFINELWTEIQQPGVYRGQCAELCGKDHGFMPIVVRAVSEEEFVAWAKEKRGGDADEATGDAAAEAATTVAATAAAPADDIDKVWTPEELYARGEAVYTTACVACHQANGMGLPPAFPPINGSAIATGPIEQHLDIVLNGRPGTAMLAFKDQLSDADIAAVMTYQRNAWDNNTGDTVQPAEVRAAR